MSALILQNENALFYECGFSSDNALLVKFPNESFFITDARYFEEAKEIIKNAKVTLSQNGDLLPALKKILKKFNTKKLYFDPNELSVSSFNYLSNGLNIKFIPKKNISQLARVKKTAHEIGLLRQAAIKGAAAFDKFAEFIKKDGIGLCEKELAFNAEIIFKNRGELGLSFPPIVAINENSSKPHALPGEKILKEGDLLLIDAGITYKRYCSDRTRTVEISKNFNFCKLQKFKDSLKQQVYDAVLKANEKAIKSIRVGIASHEVDKVARDVIEKSGFGKYFIHATGHGVGLDIHEKPRINQTSKMLLEEGMVFTIEPGIYLPNEFGVRIEDMVLVTKDGAEVL